MDVILTTNAQEEFDALPIVIRRRVDKLFLRLANWPNVSGAKPLTGDLAGFYRLRTGDYRLRFYLHGESIIVDKIGHRKDIYDD